MRILLWRLAEWNEGIEFQRRKKLATTTGGEPVHSDARECRNGIVHEADFTTALKGTQASLMHRIVLPNPSAPKQNCHPDRSAAKWRDLLFSFNPSHLKLDGSATLPFVIPTEAYPDFLLRSTGQGHVCALP
jgi:hypothetical protein